MIQNQPHESGGAIFSFEPQFSAVSMPMPSKDISQICGEKPPLMPPATCPKNGQK
jgi:hypothetical protein